MNGGQSFHNRPNLSVFAIIAHPTIKNMIKLGYKETIK